MTGNQCKLEQNLNFKNPSETYELTVEYKFKQIRLDLKHMDRYLRGS